MTQKEKLFIASKYVSKGYSQDDMRYGDDCYELTGAEGRAIKDEIAEYMSEMQEIGRTAFYEKYKAFKLY